MSKTKPNRMYHSAWDKYGDILDASGNWITCRFDGEKGTNCYEVDAPYIKIFIQEENLKPEPLPENPLTELLKDRDRLDWLLNEYGIRWDIINDNRVTREGIDDEMTDSGYKNMRDYNVN